MEYRISTEELEFFHLLLTKPNDRIVIVVGIIDNEAIGSALFLGTVINGEIFECKSSHHYDASIFDCG